jgi:CRP-like cAMP-binding protein
VAAPVELLQKIPLFSDLEGRELQTLAQSFKERTFEAGHNVATEGSGGVGFFVIGEGEAAVTVHGEERATLGPGQYFGEVALIDEGARSATIVAKTDLTCYGITAWEFRPLVESNGQIAWKLLQTLARRLREAEQREG